MVRRSGFIWIQWLRRSDSISVPSIILFRIMIIHILDVSRLLWDLILQLGISMDGIQQLN